jgi:hypothetical protein
MSFIRAEEPSGVPHTATRDGFWQKLAQALDAYFVDRSRRAVPATTLRRSKHDIDRCRRLMHKNWLAPVGAGHANFPHPNFPHHRVAVGRPR